ncbi:rod shape-determining protein MreC [Chitinasiproducens palmae]|uniref:Cell shape-determining protein MreC n=1 Tax=Chitinasiproducens palmae TaxID=1770053 RepID=A0A1H2PT61_9BURK|nr:rod shape-determining protein MreC [Chitinasiproducens palmae]SDV50285.1 rod shape-determining protein MreC [Chitinasiproducens palmae]
MDQSPPLFKQGPSALLRLIVFVLLAIALLVTDARFKTLGVVRQTIATALQPLQRAALVPRDVGLGIAGYFASNVRLQQENKALRERNAVLGFNASRAAEFEQENGHLRALLELRQQATVGLIASRVLYETRDPFARVVVIDRGALNGVQNGAPVVNEEGLIGQVTRLYPLQAEVSLLTDKDLAVPVQNMRTGVRSVVYGMSSGSLLDLRFVPLSVDIRVGDELVTSGLDGLYPPGLPVARVVRIDKQSDTAFARVLATPVAASEGTRTVLVLKYDPQLLPRPDPASALDANGKPASAASAASGAASVSGAARAAGAGASAAAPASAAARSAGGAGQRTTARAASPSSAARPAR